jgi:hypothetical protein
MLNGFSHFRRVLKTELVRSGVMESFWVLDCLAAVGKAPESMEDKLRSLRECLSADGVHLTNLGYKNLFDSMSSAMYEVRSRRKAGKKQDSASVTVTGGSFYWRGFISKQGSAKRPGSIGSSRRDGVGRATASEEVSAVVAAQRAVHERALMTDPTDIRCMNTVGMHVEFSQSLYFFLISSFLS